MGCCLFVITYPTTLDLCTNVHTFEERYEWDTKKSTANLAKHGVDFADATDVFSDSNAITLYDEHPEEERYVMLGMDRLLRIIVVVFTHRDDIVRLISARKATTTEARLYAAENA